MKTSIKIGLACVCAVFACTKMTAQNTITHDIGTGILTIAGTSTDNYVITGSTTTNYVVVQPGYQGTLTLRNLSISLENHSYPNSSPTYRIAPITIEGIDEQSNLNPVSNVNIILEGNNILENIETGIKPCLRVDQGTQINISAINPCDNASGTLIATQKGPSGSEGGAAIGACEQSNTMWTRYQPEATNVPLLSCPTPTGTTAGGNIVISSGTVIAKGGHGAGIGGGHFTYYDGMIVIYGGIIDATTRVHSAGIGSGCPTGSGVIDCHTPNSAIIVLPPASISAMGVSDLYGTLSPALALAGTHSIVYIGDTAKPLVTVRTIDFEPNANIYVDLSQDADIANVINTIIPPSELDINQVKFGQTNNAGIYTFNGILQNNTTFFTDALSSQPATLGRPYMPETVTLLNGGTVVLKLFDADWSLTSYPSVILSEGYTVMQATENACRIRIVYNDNLPMTNIMYDLANGINSDFDALQFFAADSITPISAPATLNKGDTIFVLIKIKQGKLMGEYTDILRIIGEWNGKSTGYIRLNVNQLVATEINETICEGDSVFFNNQYFSQTGTYIAILLTDTLCGINKYDSVLILNLNVIPQDTFFINAVICNGEIYSQYGFNDSVSGTYTQNLQNSFGCDSIVILNLTVDSISVELIDLKYEYCDEKNGFIEITTHNAALPVSYLWNTGETTPRIENLVGNRTYNIEVTDGNSCRIDTGFFLGVCHTFLDVDKTDETCGNSNGTITLTVSSTHPPTIKYVWDGLPTADSALTGLKSGIYKVTVSDTFCTLDETITIESTVGPVAAFEANPQRTMLGEEIQFTDKSVQGDGKITHWYWNFDDNTDSYLQNPAHRYTESGYFMVSLQIEDEFGCRDSIEHEVLIWKGLQFPNIFTPVGSDGKRYVFRPLEDDSYFEEFHIKIFNCWGNPVWEKSCKGSDCPSYDDSFWWDGTNKQGKLVSDGVYFWVVSARYSPDTKPLVKNGSVTVLSK